MKLFLTILIVGSFVMAIPSVIKNMNPDTKTESNDAANQSSSKWFETNLDIYIPKEYTAFNYDKYKNPISEGAKDTLSFEYWLGNFKIVDMINHGEFTTINLSTEIHKKFIFITSDYFVITSYMDPDEETGLTYGSSILYLPETNTLKELDTIIVLGVYKDKLIGNLEHNELGKQPFVEKGFYDIKKEKFIPQL